MKRHLQGSTVVLKRVLKTSLFGRSRYQPFWERMHLLALQGMNICVGDGSIDSGELWVLEYINKRLPRDTPVVVFDVGANTGLYSTEIVQRFAANLRLYAFEPSRETYRSLAQRMSAYQNVECFNFGFGDREEATTLYTWAGMPGLSSVYDRFHFQNNGLHGEHAHKSEETVRLTTIDDFCVERNIERIALLKLDVEGHELNILRGAADLIHSNGIDFVQFEFGGSNVDSRTFLHDFVDLLSPGYRLYRILKDGLALIEPYNERNEIFLYSNYLAVRTRSNHSR